MRRAARIDANQPAIVSALRRIGCSVLSLADLGDGCPDLLVGRHGVNILLEVKDGSKPPSKRRLTDFESEFHREWRGQVTTVETIDQALAVMLRVAP